MFKPCKIFTAKRKADYHHKHRDILNARSKLNQQINKEILARNKKTMNSYRIERDEFNNKVQNLTQTLEKSKFLLYQSPNYIIQILKKKLKTRLL